VEEGQSDGGFREYARASFSAKGGCLRRSLWLSGWLSGDWWRGGEERALLALISLEMGKRALYKYIASRHGEEEMESCGVASRCTKTFVVRGICLY